MPDDSVSPLISPHSIFPEDRTSTRQTTMDLGGGSRGRKGKLSWVVIASYVFDWAVLIVAAAVGAILGDITPNKRPFSLEDPDISFPFTVHETVPLWLLLICVVLAPIVLVAIISLVFVPGSTVPQGTPKAMIWRRKLWELHAGLLGLALSIVAAWLITNCMKNLFGKPRPDLLSRCQPDLANLNQYIVGGIANSSSNGQLVDANICKNPDKSTLDDGFRSYPSGHSSSSAAGLIYLSLFICSKFAITIPYLSPGGHVTEPAFSAFPSRMRVSDSHPESYELPVRGASNSSGEQKLQLAHRNQSIAAARRQAAAPPLYLLIAAIVPFFAAVFIASSRWFDFRHHGFDILFGFMIGTITAFFAFYYYHLPISSGAGWAWGPRSHDKAFWAGVGSSSYATDRVHLEYRAGDEEEVLHVAPDRYGHGNGRGTGLSAGSAPSASARKPQPEPQGFGEQDRNSAYMGGVAI
ncbi:PAP2 superfamily-domain-containing protein [Lasiosphaeria ovina]|uniref:PAP2 superfamily-domain-containing protein n=1 Tax=Lasiosphaeria ovina TaxID=92902 RepID=A0AAE0NLX3_9PEZI|nr:PAP2 superfamily-domain-containing protein [Lasiosphaeria ovina]